ncbi:MAG: DUF302 domain-containing protein [Pseudomonadota bacterium]
MLAATKDLLVYPSPHSVAETADRFEAAVRSRGLKVFPRVDHAAAAAEYDLEMRPTLVLSFGNPKYGTPFMLQNQAAGIDFPPRAIVFEDEEGQTFIAVNTATHLYEAFDRHGLDYPADHPGFFARGLQGFIAEAIADE